MLLEYFFQFSFSGFQYVFFHITLAQPSLTTVNEIEFFNCWICFGVSFAPSNGSTICFAFVIAFSRNSSSKSTVKKSSPRPSGISAVRRTSTNIAKEKTAKWPRRGSRVCARQQQRWRGKWKTWEKKKQKQKKIKNTNIKLSACILSCHIDPYYTFNINLKHSSVNKCGAVFACVCVRRIPALARCSLPIAIHSQCIETWVSHDSANIFGHEMNLWCERYSQLTIHSMDGCAIKTIDFVHWKCRVLCCWLVRMRLSQFIGIVRCCVHL